MASINSLVSGSLATDSRTACSNSPRDVPFNRYAEGLERVADRVLDVEEFAFEIATLRQQKPHAIARLALDESGLEPARAHNMSDAERVCRVRFVALRRHRRVYTARFQTHRRQPERRELRMQPGDKEPASWPTRRSRDKKGFSAFMIAFASVATDV